MPDDIDNLFGDAPKKAAKKATKKIAKTEVPKTDTPVDTTMDLTNKQIVVHNGNGQEVTTLDLSFKRITNSSLILELIEPDNRQIQVMGKTFIVDYRKAKMKDPESLHPGSQLPYSVITKIAQISPKHEE